jgi:tRNA-2-methylthio-N6-dimethylallyladenosine synthase
LRRSERRSGYLLDTDIIVGFPGETEEDFEETMDVVRKVGYDSAFTFLYSKRTGTPAATMEDQVEESVAMQRFDRLLKKSRNAPQDSAGKKCIRYKGLVEEVTNRIQNS